MQPWCLIALEIRQRTWFKVQKKTGLNSVAGVTAERHAGRTHGSGGCPNDPPRARTVPMG